MKTKLFRKIVETHGRASLRLQTVETWRATSLLLLLLATAPAFAQTTPNMEVCDGQGYTLKSASGKEAAGIGDSPLTFTWYEKHNDNDENEISNSNAETISIPEGRAAGTYKYTRKVASVECPGGVFTKPYTVLVNPLPVVAQSGATTLCSSGSHTLEVEASVDGGVSVAWYTNAGLSGSTVSNTASCTVSASTVVGTYTYYVQATANITQCKAAATVTATRALTEGLIGGKLIVPPTYAASEQIWIVDNQAWSDAIQIPNCNKSTFTFTTSPECVNYNNVYYYNWYYVDENKTTMCPSPWRVPTVDDFSVLVSLLGTDVKNYTGTAWGGGYYGGVAFVESGDLDVYTDRGNYWSDQSGYYLIFSTTYAMYQVTSHDSKYGEPVRCVLQ